MLLATSLLTPALSLVFFSSALVLMCLGKHTNREPQPGQKCGGLGALFSIGDVC